MKNILLLYLTLVLSSCSISEYYQVYKTTNESGTIANNEIVLEDQNCIIAYNLWAEGGDVGFTLYNKTENELVLDLKRCFFVLNGTSYTYFQNRTFSKSTNIGGLGTVQTYPYNYLNWMTTKTITTSSRSLSASYGELSEIIIPAKTKKTINEFNVSSSRYINCDLPKYPSKNKIKTLKFEKSNSPFVFYNLVTYRMKNEELKLENKFYVSEITNYPKKEIITRKFTTECGTRLEKPEEVFREVSPNKFYLHYSEE